MELRYLVSILDPKTHIVSVSITAKYSGEEELSFFLPSWSPGSYLMREYSRNIRTVKVLSQSGEFLNFMQTSKGEWKIDFKTSDIKSELKTFEIKYDVYCHELTVRTSHVDESHAFLHGPSYLMGIKDKEITGQIEFKFTPLWSKLHTGLKDISNKREVFEYQIDNYDDLLDCPVEIGCHESDGFMFDNKEHHLVWYGETYEHPYNLKKDIEVIVKTVAAHFSSVPYDNYTFMTHFKKGLYGGLEHKNSTALQFDGRKLRNREMYVNWLALVAHEYFHTWNVKRIRPIELGPFDYQNENYTRLHWLTEGLTSFMDEIFVLRSGLCTLDEYLKMQTKNLNRYFSIPGKKFHSLEDSSFNAWIKLYRPDENSNNSSISYYLKGGLVFSTLHFELKKIGKNINDLLEQLWQRYLANPKVGVTSTEVLDMVESIGTKEIRDNFEVLVTTTEDIDFETYYSANGMQFIWEDSNRADLGVEFTYQGDNVFVSKVILDSEAYKSGLNAGDEIIAIDNMRFSKDDVSDIPSLFAIDKPYTFHINRLGTILKIDIVMGKKPRILKEIVIVDEAKARAVFNSK